MGGPKWFPNFKETLPSMEGKTVVITGTTSGTGKIAADTFASLGARLVLLNRKSERSKAALEELQRDHPDAEVEQIDCDLQSFASVKSAAEEIIAKYGEGIHALANNAGIMAVQDSATGDGHDVQMQTNHLSHYLLTKLLMPLLEKGAETHGEARVVNHSSIARKGKPLEAKYFGPNGGNLGGNDQSARWDRYQQSKLANAVYTYALKDKLDSTGSKVKAVVAHPGVARTELFSGPGQGSVLGKVIKGFVNNVVAQHMADGAMALIHGVAHESVESGDFIGPGALGKKGPVSSFEAEDYCKDDANKKVLLEESEKAIATHI